MIDAAAEAETPVPRGRLFGWVVLVTVLASLSYLATAAGGDLDNDVLYRWSTAVAAVIQYGVILAVVLFLSRGIARRDLGLVRPVSWPRAVGLVVLAFVCVAVVGGLLNLVLEAGEEQGLVPEEWDSTRVTPFLANFVVVTLAAPVVEELTYRGLGVAVVGARFGVAVTLTVTSLAFGLAHGLVVALPILAFFGLTLGVVRLRTRSVYPAMALHAIFNAVALVAGVTGIDS